MRHPLDGSINPKGPHKDDTTTRTMGLLAPALDEIPEESGVFPVVTRKRPVRDHRQEAVRLPDHTRSEG
jgi:hypothetical protein